jgi:hypothetical protein
MKCLVFQCILYILWLLIFYSECVKFRPPLWSGGQSSWLQIQRSWFDSRRYQIFWNGVHSASWVQLRSCLKKKGAAPVYKTKNTAVGIRPADHVARFIRKSWH